MFRVNNKDTRTPLAFRIFDTVRHHSILSAFKNMCFRKGRNVEKKIRKNKIGSEGFSL